MEVKEIGLKDMVLVIKRLGEIKREAIAIKTNDDKTKAMLFDSIVQAVALKEELENLNLLLADNVDIEKLYIKSRKLFEAFNLIKENIRDKEI
ncbi:MAG: hypothetical protein E7H33_09550 [Clostridium perfringens]|nr:hypothetical protein [Clostridium perfringens]